MDVTQFTKQVDKGTDYAHANLFQVHLDGDTEAKFMIKASSIPAASVGMIEVPYLNRKIKVPGDRTFADWSITVIQDTDSSVRQKLIAWQTEIQMFHAWQGSNDAVGQHKRMTVSPMGRDGGAGGMGVVITGWPTEIGAIDLSWESADTIQEYTVNFAVTWSAPA